MYAGVSTFILLTFIVYQLPYTYIRNSHPLEVKSEWRLALDAAIKHENSSEILIKRLSIIKSRGREVVSIENDSGTAFKHVSDSLI